MPLPSSFYTRADTLTVAKELLGKVLVTEFDGIKTAGIISETEAYLGAKDKACHAYGNRKTKRTQTMFENGGIAYVYLCYGIHHLFNVVTHTQNNPHAVLIRGIQPINGIAAMLDRRKKQQVDKTLSAGPGTMSQALGIQTKHNGLSLLNSAITIEDMGIVVNRSEIETSPRIGVDYAEEDALLPYRFLVKSKLG